MDDEPLIKELFTLCLEIFRSVPSPPERTSLGDANWVLWRDQRDRLTVWGDGFEVFSGELDKVLVGKEPRIRPLVIAVLGRMIISLLRGMYFPDPLSANVP